MDVLVQIEAADRSLLESIAGTMAEAVRRGGEWIACKPGCTQCCIEPFAITQLDAHRLREGLRAMAISDPARAAAIRARAEAYVATAAPVYPGDALSGDLFDEDALPDSLGEFPCPALDPATGYCDLYDARPIMCRTFGPVTCIEEKTLAHCELCYEGATDEQKLACAVSIDPEGLESALLDSLEAQGVRGMTIVAYALKQNL